MTIIAPWLKPKAEPVEPTNVVTEEFIETIPPKKNKWFKGMPSPNPKGRKRGLADRRLTLKEETVEKTKEVLQIVYQRAIDGDMQAAQIMLDRTMPRLKAQSKLIQFEFDIESSMTDRAEMVMAAIAKGDVAPDVGNSLIDSMSKVHGLRQIDDLAERIAKLEGR